MIRVTVFNEFIEEETQDYIKKVYPKTMHGTIKEFLEKNDDIRVTAVTLKMPEHGLADELLNNTDVLMWWGHLHHHEVEDRIVKKVVRRVNEGMGFIPMHSAHASKPFTALMGTTCNLHWAEDRREILWTSMPSHPIAKGVPEYFNIDPEEMYGEHFDIPEPENLVFIGWFDNGCVFRSGCTFRRGHGKIFYFQPGHETSPTYHNPYIQTILTNAVRWAAPDFKVPPINMHFPHDLSKF